MALAVHLDQPLLEHPRLDHQVVHADEELAVQREGFLDERRAPAPGGRFGHGARAYTTPGRGICCPAGHDPSPARGRRRPRPGRPGLPEARHRLQGPDAGAGRPAAVPWGRLGARRPGGHPGHHRGGGNRGPGLHPRRARWPPRCVVDSFRSASRESCPGRRTGRPTGSSTARTRWSSTPTRWSGTPGSWSWTTCWRPVAPPLATEKLIRRCGGVVVGFVFLVELEYLGGAERLGAERVVSLLKYDTALSRRKAPSNLVDKARVSLFGAVREVAVLRSRPRRCLAASPRRSANARHPVDLCGARRSPPG